jgi:hypothetical protein
MGDERVALKELYLAGKWDIKLVEWLDLLMADQLALSLVAW